MLDDKIAPMLAYAARPFDSPRHLFEIKWDGARCLLFVKDGKLRLQNRRLDDITYRYPEMASLPRKLKARNAILDGELVVLSQGRSVFAKLQQREQITDPLKIRLLSRRLPAAYVAFDLLYLNDREYLRVPLMERKRLLESIMGESPYLVESRFILEKGRAFFKEAVAQGLEGIMAKALDSPYLIGVRSRHWLKIKPRGQAECYIVGYREGRGARQGLVGSLGVATREAGTWRYRGRVGTGFSEADLAALTPRLQRLKTEAPVVPLTAPVKGMVWVRPELRCRVSFHEETARGHFRAPVFEGMLE
ncbi:MAG: DNA ligase [Deltaproteobacteria bacterium]|nr:DNA ligase [Deltaproteobacteria bacterium]